jgi:diketogulonate reductase-like aldo/keto reductase
MSVTTTRIALATGAQLPQVGLGVYLSPAGAATRDAVTAALELGYRHVDTARIYGNEADVGAAIRAGRVPRDQVFVTTKLWNDDHGYDTALRGLDKSLSKLGMDHVDLYLIHWPVTGKRRESWRALERAFADGKAARSASATTSCRTCASCSARPRSSPTSTRSSCRRSSSAATPARCAASTASRSRPTAR